MALPPKEMEQAILSATGLKKQKEQLQFLKKEHGLGYFQAAVVVKQLEKNGGTDYSDEPALLEAQFGGKNANLRDLYNALAARVLALGTDVSAKPCKTYIPFYRKGQFLIARPKNGILYLALPLSSHSFKGEILTVKGLALPEKFAFAIPLKTEKDLIAEGLFEWIGEVYSQH